VRRAQRQIEQRRRPEPVAIRDPGIDEGTPGTTIADIALLAG
jgi:hypothetical protein